jgi:HSP20 family molecular chaperone IbpA
MIWDYEQYCVSFNGFKIPYSALKLDGFQAEPKHYIEEKDDHIKITFIVPGRNKNNISVEFNNNILVLKGDKLAVEPSLNFEEKINFSLRVGNYNFDSSKIKCTAKDGIVTVFLPKKSTSQKITIE